METSREKKCKFIREGIGIEQQLYRIFKRDELIRIADIGACDGLSTIIYSIMFPKAEFYVFEPVKSNYDEMMANFEEFAIRNRVVGAVNCALSDRECKTRFYRSKGQEEGMVGWDCGNKSSSILKPKQHLRVYKWCEFEEEEISCVTLDGINGEKLSSQYQIKIDFAHIDVQGAELKVLRGGKKTFGSTKAIWLEVANEELYEGQPLKRDVMLYLSGVGFKLILDTATPEYGNPVVGNMLWAR
jgi:FkbM family methyltransferase